MSVNLAVSSHTSLLSDYFQKEWPWLPESDVIDVMVVVIQGKDKNFFLSVTRNFSSRTYNHKKTFLPTELSNK